jgi:hypothetical protein
LQKRPILDQAVLNTGFVTLEPGAPIDFISCAAMGLP